jgi:pantoate--beta-alanine ligase
LSTVIREPTDGPLRRIAALCAAAYIGTTRLIDNVILAPRLF